MCIIYPLEPIQVTFRPFFVKNATFCNRDPKNDDFLVKILFTENRILLLRYGFGHDPVRLLWAPWDIYTRIPGRIFKKLIIPVYGMALWYENFWPKKSTKKSSFFGVHGDTKLHFFTKNCRNVTWMCSNGYIMHITYLNYVDISPAEPQKIDFQGVQNCKNDENRKNDDFLVKIFFTENRILLLRLALGMTQ